MKKLLATALVLTMGLSVSAGVLDKVDNALNKADTAVTNSLNKATAKKNNVKNNVQAQKQAAAKQKAANEKKIADE